MKDWPFCAISLEVCYLFEVPFPVAHLKNEEKTGFALVIMISNQEVIDITLLSSECI